MSTKLCKGVHHKFKMCHASVVEPSDGRGMGLEMPGDGHPGNGETAIQEMVRKERLESLAMAGGWGWRCREVVQPETPEVGEAGDGVGDGGQSDWRWGWCQSGQVGEGGRRQKYTVVFLQIFTTAALYDCHIGFRRLTRLGFHTKHLTEFRDPYTRF
jgi:hypothetical protein